jgi:hypothetical protein
MLGPRLEGSIGHAVAPLIKHYNRGDLPVSEDDPQAIHELGGEVGSNQISSLCLGN